MIPPLDVRPFFASIIGFAVNHNHNLLEAKLVKKCNQIKKKTAKGGSNWLSRNTYNTLGTFDIVDNKDFLPIQNFVIDSVMSYASKAQIDVTHLNPRPHEGWFNIYEKNDYQEYHIHGASTLSTIYFLSGGRDHAKESFKSPVNQMSRIKYKQYNDLTFKEMLVDPLPGLCVIFDSSLEHAVEQQVKDQPRISLAYNFKDL